MAELSSTGRRLTQELQRLRDLAGLSGREMARRVGVSQPTLSRIDRGVGLPSVPVVRLWLDVCQADDATRARVLSLAESAHAETRTWRALLAGEGHLQRQVRDLDAAASRIRNYQHTVLPGLLQTAAYANAVLERGRTTDVAAAVAGRLDRQQLLHEPGRRFEFLVAEPLLRKAPRPGALVGQADRLLSLATLESVALAVLPDDVDPGVELWHNFVIRYPSAGGVATVSVELQHGSTDISDPESVQVYEDVWERAWAVALHGDEALAVVRGAGV